MLTRVTSAAICCVCKCSLDTHAPHAIVNHDYANNTRNFAKVMTAFNLFMAGKHAAFRDAHLAMARVLRRDDRQSRMVKLYVDFARDEHREYLHLIRQVRA